MSDEVEGAPEEGRRRKAGEGSPEPAGAPGTREGRASPTGADADPEATPAAGEAPEGASGPERVTAWIGAAVLYGGMALIALLNWLDVGEGQLQVVARVVSQGTDTVVVPVAGEGESAMAVGPWLVQGRVVFEGTFPEDAVVWAVAQRADGQEYAPQPGVSGDAGAFSLGPIPTEFAATGATVTVTASADVAENGDTERRTGRTAFSVMGGGEVDSSSRCACARSWRSSPSAS